MTKPKVLIARKVPGFVEEYIGKYCEYEMLIDESVPSQKSLIERLQDKEGLMVVGTKIDEALLQHAPNLKVVSNITVGYNNFDIEAMGKRNIIGTNTPEVLDDTVADLVFTIILATARRVPELDRYVKEGRWKESDVEVLFGKDVHHATLGIIGMGRIGQKVAKRAKFGFDMKVLYHNRRRNQQAEKELGVVYEDFEPLLKASDFVLIMAPLTNETYHMIGEQEFQLMKEDAIFINASRGATVDEKALIQALKDGEILAAGLDVFEHEPIESDNLLLNLHNVVTLPHIGSATGDTRGQMAMLAATNMVKALYGETPPNIVPELKA